MIFITLGKIIEIQQIIKTLKNRIDGMTKNAEQRHEHGLKQQAEEIGYLLEMLENKIES